MVADPVTGVWFGTVGVDAAVAATGGVHGLPPALTSFVGRDDEARKLDGLLGEYRLVTVTGPGGVGKTRLACEVARRTAGRFADGVWLVELAAAAELCALVLAAADDVTVLATSDAACDRAGDRAARGPGPVAAA